MKNKTTTKAKRIYPTLNYEQGNTTESGSIHLVLGSYKSVLTRYKSREERNAIINVLKLLDENDVYEDGVKIVTVKPDSENQHYAVAALGYNSPLYADQ